MQLIELIGESGEFRADLGLATIGGAHSAWVEITAIEIVGGSRPPIDGAPAQLLAFGTGEFLPDTLICLYHIDQGPFPTRLILPPRQNGELRLQQGLTLIKDWSLEFRFEWRTRAAPSRWLP